MLTIGQIIELGPYKMRVTQFLGGHDNLTYRTVNVQDETSYILRVIRKPSITDFKEGMTPEKETLLKKFYEENDILKEKYPTYCVEAGFEILSSALQGQVAFEAKILKDYSHPGLSNLLFYTQDDKAYYLVLDYIIGKNIQEIIEARDDLPEEQILRWLRQIAETLNFLHTHDDDKILYNNLNPLNIIIDQEANARLVDLQKIRVFDPESGKSEEWQDVLSLDAPPPYSPLEGYSNPQAELYALGATFYYLLTGQHVPEAKARTRHDPLQPVRVLKSGYSAKLSTVLSLCLEMNPLTRFTTAASLLKAIDMEDFATIRVEKGGEEIRSLPLGKRKRSFEQVLEITMKKSIPEDPSLVRVNHFSYTWNMKPETEEPRIELRNIKQVKGFTIAELAITASDVPEGLYEGSIEIDTNWGSSEISIKCDIMAEKSRLPLMAGGAIIIAILLIAGFCRLFPPKPYDRITKKWNADNWDALKFTISSYVSPRADIASEQKWEVYGQIPEISIIPSLNRMDISGTLAEDGFVRTGWISSIFHPVGNISISASMEDLEKAGGHESSGMMLLSSNGNAVGVEFCKSGKNVFRVARRIDEKWSYTNASGDAVQAGEKGAVLKIVYNKVDDMAEVSVNGKPSGKVPVILDDLGILFYVTLRKNGEKVNISFNNLSITSGPSVPRMPPYYQVARGEYPILKKPVNDSPRVSKTLTGEKVIVQEERAEWCRIRTIQEGEYEGWVKRIELRDLYPKETLLDR